MDNKAIRSKVGKSRWILAWGFLALIIMAIAITKGAMDASPMSQQEVARLEGEIAVIKETLERTRERLNQGRDALEKLHSESTNDARNASSLAFWRKHVDEIIFDKAAIRQREEEITRAENLLSEHQYAAARDLYHAIHNDYRKKLEWFRGREKVWQNLPARLATDKQKASYGQVIRFSERHIYTIRHKIDMGWSYSGIEDYFQGLTSRYTFDDIVNESDKEAGRDEQKLFRMLSYYLAYEMASDAEQDYKRFSVDEGGLHREAVLMGWRDYIQYEKARISAEETRALLEAMWRSACQ